MDKRDSSTASHANQLLQETIDQNKPRIFASYALVGAILLLGGLGYALDGWAGTSPWFLLIGLMSAVVVGFANLIRSTRKA